MIQGKQETFIRKPSSNSESDFHIEEGMAILLQSDIFSMLFQPLFEENKINLRYLGDCIQEYIRSLMNHDIQVQNSLQILLANIFLKINDFEKLQKLLQYRILADSFEMSILLIEASNQFSAAFHLAVDMIHRLNSHDKLIDMLIEKKFMFEALQIMNHQNSSKLDIIKFITKCQQGGDEKIILIITRF